MAVNLDSAPNNGLNDADLSELLDKITDSSWMPEGNITNNHEPNNRTIESVATTSIDDAATTVEHTNPSKTSNSTYCSPSGGFKIRNTNSAVISSEQFMPPSLTEIQPLASFQDLSDHPESFLENVRTKYMCNLQRGFQELEASFEDAKEELHDLRFKTSEAEKFCRNHEEQFKEANEDDIELKRLYEEHVQIRDRRTLPVYLKAPNIHEYREQLQTSIEISKANMNRLQKQWEESENERRGLDARRIAAVTKASRIAGARRKLEDYLRDLRGFHQRSSCTKFISGRRDLLRL